MPSDLSLSCTCGEVQAKLNAAAIPHSAFADCHCKWCLATAIHFEKTDRLISAQGGTKLVIAEPRQVTFTKGWDHMRFVQLTKGGPMRWCASCCNTPIVNTLTRPFPPFASFLLGNFNAPEGTFGTPVHVNVDRIPEDQRPQPNGGLTAKIMKFKVALRFLKAKLTGSFKDTPFFDIESGKATVEKYRLDQAEIDTALAAAEAWEK